MSLSEINKGLSGLTLVQLIDGKVQTFADLPDAAAHEGEIWAVLQSTGVYLINRKNAGLYISDGVDWNIFSAFNFPSIFATSPITYDPSTGEISTSMSTNRLIGRSTSGTGVMEQITIGTNLNLTAGALNADLSGYVPYTGATQDVDLGTNDLTTTGDITTGNGTINGYLDIAAITPPTAPSTNIARMYAADAGGFTQLNWVDSLGTAKQIGRDSILSVRNVTGATLLKGKVVYISGSTGVFPEVSLAKADSVTTLPVMGFVVNDISNNSFGQIMVLGDLQNVNTSGFSDGDVLYVSATTAGDVTTTPPSGSGIVHRVGIVINGGSVGAGVIAVFIGDVLDEGFLSHNLLAGLQGGTTNEYYHLTSAQHSALVTGAASSTDDALVRFNGTTGKVIQNSGIIVDDSNNISGIGSINAEGNLVVGRENNGSPVVSVVSNSGTGGVRQSVVAASGGDAQYNLSTDSGVISHSTGLDDSDSSKLKRQFSPTVGTSSYEIVTQDGIITHPLNPNFLATVTSTLSNVTGDGTNYTVIFGTEITDYAANYDTSTGTFTAPVTGMYQFNAVILLSGLVAGNNDGQMLLVTSNRTYNTRQNVGAIRDTLDRCSLQISQACDMDAGDTAVIQILVGGGAKVTDILSGGASSFSGFLIG